MSLGQRIRAARKEAGLSQTELALQIGSHSNLVSRWERDLSEPSLRNLLHLSLVLQRDPMELLNGDKEEGTA